MRRFKIDISDYTGSRQFGLFIRVCWGWQEIDSFKAKEEARAMYEKIKDLPEYLN
jgi:hypothetical protein